MAGSNRIEVMLFHHLQIFFHLFHSDYKSGYRIGIMTIYPFEFDRNLICINYCISDRDFPYSNSVNNHFSCVFQDHCIQVWLLRIP